MSDALDYIVDKFGLDLNKKSPIEIPNIGRGNLGGLFKELGFMVGAEIGVERGLFSEKLCQGHPEMKLYGVDAWATYTFYREHVSQSKLDGFYDDTLERMKPYNFYPIRAFSMDAIKHFPDNSLDFVYIDANHEFNHVANDLHEWSKKVRPGGIISGHDYRKSKAKGRYINHVVYVIHAYVQCYRIHPWFLLGTKAKVSGQIRDTTRSWFWMKHA